MINGQTKEFFLIYKPWNLLKLGPLISDFVKNGYIIFIEMTVKLRFSTQSKTQDFASCRILYDLITVHYRYLKMSLSQNGLVMPNTLN